MPVIQKREYGKNGTTYSQYRINVSQKIIESLNWKGNDTIEMIIQDGKLVCKKLSE